MMHPNHDSLDLMKFRNSYAYSAFYMLDTVLASLRVLTHWVFPTIPEGEILTVSTIELGKLRHREANSHFPLKEWNGPVGCLGNTNSRLVTAAELCGGRQRKCWRGPLWKPPSQTLSCS